MTDLTQRPRTLAPPPLVYAAGLGAGWWLQQVLPLGFTPSLMARQVAWGALVFGLAFMLWAVWTIWRHHTTVNPYKAASTLVTHGPFAYTRNPIYVADMLVYFAIAVLMGTVWPVFFLPLVWVIMRYAVIAHEEAHLTAKFGDTYRDYCARVRRWL
ncbi:methyltransferase family protein [Sulfuriferula thiophila]|uniref:methyltransferase family protein n=1 Tax=Sulfuriferula thiophila TaxID=1781211 RepID=UPI000F606452|nr:isoprenylcysteine carboxylmethyltransferase family protein [Sulfuriferula thiophila]